jgi:uncharacterized protein (TIGR00730 family)
MDYTDDSRPLDPNTKRVRKLVDECVEEAGALLGSNATIGDLKIVRTVLKELRDAFETFAPYRDHKKVTLFGSARTKPEARGYRFAEEFARRAAEAGFMVITGAGPGIMEAGLRGAGRKNSFGVAITLPFEQSVNEFVRGDPKVAIFKYFFTRKLFFLKETHAVASFPGGYGTQDEAFETLTLVQTGKAQPMPLLFLEPPGNTYWKSWHRYVKDHLLRRGMISEEDLSLFKVTTDIDEAVEEITSYYRVYNSSRYVRDLLVFRLNRKLSARFLRELDRDFSDILIEGKFEQRGAFPVERDDPEVSHLPRLVFHFNSHHYGRLRMLIDRINQRG